MKRFSLVLFLVVSTAAAAAPRRRAGAPYLFPPCSMIAGTPAVTFTLNSGATLAPTAERLSGIGYTYGLAALDASTLLSWHKDTLSLSTDSGCSWRPLGQWQTDFPPTITAARGGRAFAWSDNRQFLLRYDARGPQVLKAPAVIVGLGTDPQNGDRLRAGDAEGGLWESTDGGDSWASIGRLPREATSLIYRFSFDPRDLDHIVAGTAVSGAFVTFDGGRNWSRTSLADNFNVMNFAMSPIDTSVVWAMAVDLRTSDHSIYRSTDGGRTFSKVVTESAEVSIINGPVMAAYPGDANVLYFVFGTRFQGYGTDLFRYDAATKTLTKTHNANHDVNAIAFSPADPTVMYLGLEIEEGVF